MTGNYFTELAGVDCSAHTEKKGRFTYLSWPFAFAELFKRHPDAMIEVHEWDGLPVIQGPKGWLVKVTVDVRGIKRTQWHPVLDNNNRPIAAPDVFQINTSIQRATVKAIALHGLGLYIYAGEDIPGGTQDAEQAAEPEKPVGRPLDGAWEALSEDEQAAAQEHAAILAEYMAEDDAQGAVDYLDRISLTNEQKTGLWTLLPSKTRSAIKKELASRK